jgi:hypothetical protein
MANTPTTQITDTQVFFNGYFNQPLQVSDAVWQQIYGYFYNLTNSADAANALAQSVISLTYNNNLNPLDLIKQFQQNPNSNSVKTLLISFFNSIKGSTSKLGYQKPSSVSPVVSKNILA